MIDKVQKIREEVEKKLEVMQYQVHRKDAYKELKGVLAYIDSLQEEPVNKGLGEIILEGANFSKSWYAHPELAFKACAKGQKAKLMENAIDVTVHIDAGGYPYIPQMELYDYDKDIPLAKEGDRYKVILIKEG